MYAISARVSGAIPIKASEKNLKADVTSLLDSVTERTKIVFIANPNNPTGSYLTREEVLALHAGLPSHVLLVLDCAYAEYVEAEDYSAGHELVEAHENIVVTRTFSKAYALGGLRLGWGHCSAGVADVLNRVRGPFNVSSVAQAAGLAALEDEGFLAQSVAHNTQWREWTREKLEGLGLWVAPSVANFLLVDFESEEKALACLAHLKENNIFVRGVGAYGLSQYLRISIGTEKEMTLAVSAMKAYVQSYAT